METWAGFWLLAVLLVAALIFTQTRTENKYFKVGGDLQLSPQKVSEIYSIVWKYDKYLLAEWVKGSIPLTYYSKFRGRSELNTTTGVLVIHSLTADDTGVYTVEINNKVQIQIYQTVVIQEVPQPVVDLQLLACTRLQNCSLKCYGDIANAGPVSYFWKKDDGGWDLSGDKKELSDEEMDSVKNFSCRMKNPVSEKDSEPFRNPFYQENDLNSERWIVVLGAVMRSLAILALFVVVVCFVCEKLQSVCESRRSDDNAG